MNRTVYVPWLLFLGMNDKVRDWLANLPADSYRWDSLQLYITFKYEEDIVAFKLRFKI